MLGVSIFAALSALFHLYVMRRGAFLTNHDGRSLADDFHRIPRLFAGFVAVPARLLALPTGRSTRAAESGATLKAGFC